MAMKAARQIEFKPALNNGQEVIQRIAVEYEFYLCPEAPICTKVTEIIH